MDIGKLTEEFFSEANKRDPDGIVTLVRSDREREGKPAIWFSVKFYFRNPWINRAIYDEGSAIIYLSDLFYEDIDRLSIKYFGVTPRWNNTRSIGWIYPKG